MYFCKIFRMADDDVSKSLESNRRENDPDAEAPLSLRLDLGDDSSRPEENRLGNQNAGNSGSNSTDGQHNKREDNPFSFKHFLRSDSGNSYTNKGARPKVYNETRSSPSDYSDYPKQSKVVPEFSSALPDFVQDHLVVEQCYLGNSNVNDYDLDLNLPDFAPGRENGNKPVPLDLPVRGGFPLDLPITNSSTGGGMRNCQSVSEVGNSKSLPDFLADSAVCSQKGETLSVPHSPEGELERLKQELEITRRQLSEKNRLCEGLSRELEIARNKEHEYTQNLAKALEQVEDNLEKSNRRAVSAESTVSKLRQEIKSLTGQVNGLKIENQGLRGEEAAGGGHIYYNSTNEVHSHRLAQELRAAASTAEHSLRQLLTGVDNLRIMAASLENLHRIEEKNDPFSHFDEDAGPAL